MNSENVKKPHVIAVMTVAALLLATAALTMTNIGNAFAYESSQGGSQANDCGNGQDPFNVLCQNLFSQIEGDGNAVNIIGLQTGGERTTPPETCEECFTFVLSAAEQTQLIDLIAQNFNSGITSIEDLCDTSDNDGIFTPEDIAITEQLLGEGTTVPPVQGMNLGEDRIADIIDCLHRILGF